MESVSELDKGVWAMISWGRVLSFGLTYSEAFSLAQQHYQVTGEPTCVVTTTAAERLLR